MCDLLTNKLHICPVCAKEGLEYPENRKWKCPGCGFTLYNNVAAAVGVIISFDSTDEYEKQAKNDDVSVLFIKRGRDPRKGFYAFPGGFIDPDETAEQACIREAKEETGLEIASVRFVCSAPNSYMYKDVGYKTCDLFFDATLSNSPTNTFSALKPEDAAEITDFKLFPVQSEADIEAIPFAFPSAAVALRTWFAMRQADIAKKD